MKYYPKLKQYKNSSGTNVFKNDLAYSYGHHIYARCVNSILYVLKDDYSQTTAQHKRDLIKTLGLGVIYIDGNVNSGLVWASTTETAIKEKISTLMSLQLKPRIRKTTIDKYLTQILELEHQLTLLPIVFA